MKLAIATIGILLVAIWLVDIWTHRARAKRRAREAREAREMHHITGSRRWWKEPPDEPPEGDY